MFRFFSSILTLTFLVSCGSNLPWDTTLSGAQNASGSVQWSLGYTETLIDTTQGVQVTEEGVGSIRSLLIQTSPNSGSGAMSVKTVIRGAVLRADLADLDGDKRSELVVYLQSTNTPPTGSIMIYSLLNGPQLIGGSTPLTGEYATGYRGYDAWEIVDGVMFQKFPFYLPSDEALSANGGEKTIRYSVQERENQLLLIPSKQVVLATVGEGIKALMK